MPVNRLFAAELVCSRVAAAPAVRSIEAIIDANQTGALKLCYTLKGALPRLIIPPAAPPRRVDGLWKHTCFEAFIRVKDSAGYLEFNFSPSGEWAAYEFGAYRDGAPIDDESVAPIISTELSAGQLTLTAMIQLDRLSLRQSARTLRVGLSAVIEAADGSLSYWALTHPSDKPDFHHADSFALELALPPESA
ncbi:MAG: DOMON-like domain-containing protein [Deltaproteobacteria bacterium]|nr:DOMON-like domain-containing protein [Deltaproteobacteria bacterium]